MALPLLALLPALFKGVETATALFSAGRETVAAITGKPSTASDASGLIAEVSAMTPDQQAKWAEAQQAVTDQYEAETRRLMVEQGTVDAATLDAIGDRAGKVAYLRMATRPRIVLRLSHVVMLPVYVFAIDGSLMLTNIILKGFGTPYEFGTLAGDMFGDGSLYLELYKFAAPTAASVILGYMGLREIGKAKGSTDGDGLGGAVTKATGLVRRLLKR